MCDGGGDGGEAEPISERKEYAEVDFANPSIRVTVNLELFVHDG